MYWVWGEEKNKHTRANVENNTGSRDSSKLLQQVLWKIFYHCLWEGLCALDLMLMASWEKAKHALEFSIQKEQWYMASAMSYTLQREDGISLLLPVQNPCFQLEVYSLVKLVQQQPNIYRLYCWIWHVFEKVKFVLEIIKFWTKCLLQSKKQVLHGVVGLSLDWTERLIAIPVPGGRYLNTQLFRCHLLGAKAL